MAGDSEVLTVKEVCELLRVHPSTVYKLLRQGKLPSFRVGSEWRFRKDLVMSWMAQRSMEAQQMRRVIMTGVNGDLAIRRPYVNLNRGAAAAQATPEA